MNNIERKYLSNKKNIFEKTNNNFKKCSVIKYLLIICILRFRNLFLKKVMNKKKVVLLKLTEI